VREAPTFGRRVSLYDSFIRRRAAKNAEIVFCLPLRRRKAKKDLAFVRVNETIHLPVLGNRAAAILLCPAGLSFFSLAVLLALP
jgi:hypothetical protein